MHVEYPMLFKAESTSSGRFTHCGVLEFVAEEGVVYMPHWVSSCPGPEQQEIAPHAHTHQERMHPHSRKARA